MLASLVTLSTHVPAAALVLEFPFFSTRIENYLPMYLHTKFPDRHLHMDLTCSTDIWGGR